MGDANLKTRKNFTLFLMVDNCLTLLGYKTKGHHSTLLSSKHTTFSLGFVDLIPQGIAI